MTAMTLVTLAQQPPALGTGGVRQWIAGLFTGG